MQETFDTVGTHVIIQVLNGSLLVYDPHQWCVCSKTRFEANSQSYVESRCRAVISLLHAAVGRVKRDFEFVFSLDDQPRWNAIDFNRPWLGMHPGFGAVRCRRSGTLALPFFGSHALWAFGEHAEQFPAPPSESEFLSRRPSAVFRGRVGGCSGDWFEMGGNRSFFWLFNRNRTAACGRALVAQLSQARPDKVDFNKTDFLTLQKQADRFRYVLSVEGHAGWAERLLALFASGMLLFNQDHPCTQWFEPQARPYEHFIPVRNDLADLIDRIEWADEHPSTAYAIVQNAFAFANRYLTKSGVLEYASLVLDDYAARLLYRPMARAGSVAADELLTRIVNTPRSVRSAHPTCRRTRNE